MGYLKTCLAIKVLSYLLDNATRSTVALCVGAKTSEWEYWFREKSHEREFSTAPGNKTFGEIVAARCNTREARAESCLKRHAGSDPGIRLERVVVRTGGPGVRSEFTRDAGGELFLVSRAGGAAAAVFPIGRKTFSRAALAGFGFADCFNGACEFVGCDQASVEHHVARGCGLGAAGPIRHWPDLPRAVAHLPPRGEGTNSSAPGGRSERRLILAEVTSARRYKISRISS